MQTSFEILSTAREYLESRIAKLNKRAAKIGCQPIELQWSEGRVEIEVEEQPAYGDARRFFVAADKLTADMEKTGNVRQYLNLQVIGETPKYAGWTFCGTLEPLPLDDGSVENLILTVPGQQIPVEYKTLVGHCDHCKTARRRRQTFVVRDDNGQYKCVGRQCLADFVGGADPAAIAQQVEWWGEIQEVCSSGSDGYGSPRFSGWDLQVFLSWTASAIRHDGWLSRTTARETERVATADWVMQLLTPQSFDSQKIRDMRRERIPADDHFAAADAAIEWCRQLTDAECSDSEYLANINLIARSGVVNYKAAGFAASILIAYQKATDRLQAKKQEVESQHVGTAGQRSEFTVTCEKIFCTEGFYGSTGIHRMRDAAGNLLVWFASNSAEWMDEGRTYQIKATVKEHSEYKGRKQTVVSRVKLLACQQTENQTN